MSHLISAFWRWGLRNWERSLAHGAEEDTPSLWGSLVAPTFCSSRDHRGGIGLQSCGGFPLASLSSDAVRNSPLRWILQSQTDQRSPEVEALDSFIAPGWLFIHRRFHPGKLPSWFADCLVETFKGTSPHFLKENLMKTVPEEGGEQINYSITSGQHSFHCPFKDRRDAQDSIFRQAASSKGRFQGSFLVVLFSCERMEIRWKYALHYRGEIHYSV